MSQSASRRRPCAVSLPLSGPSCRLSKPTACWGRSWAAWRKTSAARSSPPTQNERQNMSSSALYSPPRPPVRTGELGWYQLLKTLRGNALEMWPERAYEQEILVNRFFGRQRVLLNAPEAVHHVLVENAANYRRSPASIRILRPLVG